MDTTIQDQLLNFADNVLEFLPTLAGGIILIFLGWLIGWIVKKILFRVSLLLRVDRFLKQSHYEAGLSKADVRYSFYNLIGNIGFIIIFLIFLNSALVVWNLEIVSDLLSKVIMFLPKIIIAVFIFGIGWLLSSWAQKSVYKSLHREEIPRASLISKFTKSLVLIFFSAVALIQLDISNIIIIIGFATIFVTLGVIAVILTVKGSNNIIKKIDESMRDDNQDR